jgi:hypothetical protein
MDLGGRHDSDDVLTVFPQPLSRPPESNPSCPPDSSAKMLGRSRFEQPVDLAPYVAEIRKKAAALLVLLDEINEAHRAGNRARIARSRAKDVFDRVYLRAARIFEDLCRFAGLDDLAVLC